MSFMVVVVAAYGITKIQVNDNPVKWFTPHHPIRVADRVLNHRWAGLTYLNVVWQDKMVAGMFKSLMGSFLIVLIMMTFLFRSIIWGLVAMVPLSITITLIYGFIGLIGKDYDMPVAVLSSLTLGMAVDFAIHFLERSRSAFAKTGNWKAASRAMFEEPSRAITRNVIVVAVGFTPLMLAPLMPYKTVGIFLASIMAISGLATMIIIPSLLTLMKDFMFRKLKPQPGGLLCQKRWPGNGQDGDYRCPGTGAAAAVQSSPL